MNFKLHNADLKLLGLEGKRARFGQSPGWTGVDWKPTTLGGNMIYLRGLALPQNCFVKRTDVKIEAPPSLYEPVANGRLAFYQNIWISPDVRIRDPRSGQWVNMPRLHSRQPDGFAYLCLHPDPVRPGKNILDFIRTFDLFLMNPGYKAGAHEHL